MTEPKEKGSAFFPISADTNLDRVFSLQHERQVRNDNTVSFKNLTLQIPKSSIRHHFVRCNVKIYEHLNGDISIGFGPHTIAKFSVEKTVLQESPKQNQNESQGAKPLGLTGRPKAFAHNVSTGLTLPMAETLSPVVLARVSPQGGVNNELY